MVEEVTLRVQVPNNQILYQNGNLHNCLFYIRVPDNSVLWTIRVRAFWLTTPGRRICGFGGGFTTRNPGDDRVRQVRADVHIRFKSRPVLKLTR